MPVRRNLTRAELTPDERALREHLCGTRPEFRTTDVVERREDALSAQHARKGSGRSEQLAGRVKLGQLHRAAGIDNVVVKTSTSSRSHPARLLRWTGQAPVAAGPLRSRSCAPPTMRGETASTCSRGTPSSFGEAHRPCWSPSLSRYNTWLKDSRRFQNEHARYQQSSSRQNE